MSSNFPPTWISTVEAAQGALPASLGIVLEAIPDSAGEWGLRVQWREGNAVLRVIGKRIRRIEELGALCSQIGREDQTVLVTPYLTAHLGRRCVELGLQFLDGAGNLHLALPGLLLCNLGNRVPEGLSLPGSERSFKGFNRKGLQVVFGLLAGDELINAPYRELGKAVGVATGTVGEVFTGLAEAGLLLKRQEKRLVLQRERLLEGWIANYPYKLRPHLQPRRYRGRHPQWWEQVTLDPLHAQWGGEVAADRLTEMLQPGGVTLYTSLPQEKLAAQLRLRPDPDGEVEILERFWAFPNPEGYPADLVPPLLVYVDLLGSGDPRNADIARMIHETHLTA